MSFATLLLIALGLSMDAFGASVGRGASLGHRIGFPHILKAGLLFGAFAALAPLIGWTVGKMFYALIEAYDHWIALVLLSVVGSKMVYDGWAGDGGQAEASGIDHGYRLLVIVAAAVATSIDAVAVGITLPAFHVNILLAAGLIGSVTFLASVSGTCLGRAAGRKMGSPAEIIGGLLLIAIGIRIVLEHTYWAPASHGV